MCKPTAPAALIVALAVMESLAAACQDQEPELGIGSAQVTVATTGADLDPDGYNVSVDGGSAQSVAINSAITFPGLHVGVHTVALAGVADNCTVSGGSVLRTVTVGEGVTARIDFSIACVAASVVVVTVKPGAVTIDPNATVQLVATAQDARGTPLSGRAITWASANPTVAAVMAPGLAIGVAAGGTTVTATVEGISGSATVLVTGTPIDLHGEWSLLEVYSEAFCSMEGPCYGYAECSDTGSFDFAQTEFAFVGTGNQVGSCDLGERAVTNGRIAGRRITFIAGACQYQGELSALLERLNASGECADGRTTTVLAYRRSSQ